MLKYSGNVDSGYKVDLPEEVLKQLLDSNASPPFVFELKHENSVVYAGVREFLAPPNEIRLNSHIAADLGLELMDSVSIELVELKKGTQITVRPRTPKPVDYRSLLESWLPKNYTALWPGATLRIDYLNCIHELEVTNLEPNQPVCIVDTDMDLIVEGEVLESQAPLTLELGVPLDLGGTPKLATCSVPDTDKLYIETTGLVCVGPEHATSHSSFVCITDSQISVLTALLSSSFSVYGTGTVTVRATEPVVEVSENTTLCSSCSQQIPNQSFTLHLNFCSRNRVECPECHKAFINQVSGGHAQLHELTKTFDDELSCGVCDFRSNDATSLAFHRATTCPGRLHTCRFCHLLLPQGETSPVDALQGLTAHESMCGTRTADCSLCSRPVRLRNLAAHLMEHEAKKQEQKPPKLCINSNCPNVLDDKKSPLDLCAMCYGPLSVPGQNTDLDKINQRVERRLVLQLIRGCGRSYCRNAYCAIGGNKKYPASEAVKLAKQLQVENQLSFCVDENSTKRNMFVALENDYDPGWRGLAISSCGSEAEANRWLERNAAKRR